MKILLVGVFSTGSTDLWKKLALARLGHRVFPFAYRDQDWRTLHRIGESWDLVLVSKGTPGLTREAFDRLREISVSRVLWWPDPLRNWTDVLTDVVADGRWTLCATSHAVIEEARNLAGAGFPAARVLEGADCEGPREDWAPRELSPTLLHFGHVSERRAGIIARLRRAGVAVDVLDRPVYGPALQLEVLRHAAVLGINSSHELYSNRVQTVVAMGGCVMQESAPGLDTDFAVECESGAVVTWREDSPLMELTARTVCARPVPDAAWWETARRSHAANSWDRAMAQAIQAATGGPA